MKQKIKQLLLRRLWAKPEIISRIATRVVNVGVSNYLTWDYQSEKARVLRCLEGRRCGRYEYTFSASSTRSTLYTSAYACMLLGLHGEIERTSEWERQGWIAYFDEFQSESDGLFRDPVLTGVEFESDGNWGDGWGIRHLAAHLSIAYSRLGGVPRYPFKFLEPYFDEGYMERWLARFDFSLNIWSASNYVMNLYSLLEYARDEQRENRANQPIEQMLAWLVARQNPTTGLWHDYAINGYPELGDAIRGAYHFYPLFSYEGKTVPHRERVIDCILRSQNSWGGFEADERPSGACEDIDALEPLVRFAQQTGHRKAEVDLVVRRALVWVLANRHADGGYESLMENGCHYGNHPETTSLPKQSNLFATWFRTLCLAYMTNYLGIPNEYKVGRFPGYEIALEPEEEMAGFRKK
jgi:hypothetical protein